MNDIQVFNNPKFGDLRATEINGEPYFVGKDVAEALGYARARDAIRAHVEECDKGAVKRSTPGGEQTMTIINESGLYALIFGSKLETAREFKHWVTSEVLPTIRKHGAYMNAETLERALLNPDTIIKLAENLKAEQIKNQALTAENEMLKPKAFFADAVGSSSTTILIGDLAKLLKQNGYETGQKRLFEQLRREGFLIKSGISYNMPTQKAMDLGLFEIKERTSINGDGTVRIMRTTKVTGRGQIYFINRYCKKD